MNLPWSRCVKMQRGTSVNGDERELLKKQN
jgi:hypothetical protein